MSSVAVTANDVLIVTSIDDCVQQLESLFKQSAKALPAAQERLARCRERVETLEEEHRTIMFKPHEWLSSAAGQEALARQYDAASASAGTDATDAVDGPTSTSTATSVTTSVTTTTTTTSTVPAVPAASTATSATLLAVVGGAELHEQKSQLLAKQCAAIESHLRDAHQRLAVERTTVEVLTQRARPSNIEHLVFKLAPYMHTDHLAPSSTNDDDSREHHSDNDDDYGGTDTYGGFGGRQAAHRAYGASSTVGTAGTTGTANTTVASSGGASSSGGIRQFTRLKSVQSKKTQLEQFVESLKELALGITVRTIHQQRATRKRPVSRATRNANMIRKYVPKQCRVPGCGGPLRTDKADAVCGKCGQVDPSMTSYYTDIRPGKKKQAYLGINHFETIIQRLQGKENVRIDPAVIENLRERMRVENITDPKTQINYQLVRKWLRANNQVQYYDNVQQITAALGGPEPPEVTGEQIKMFRDDYHQQSEIFEFVKGSRQNSLNNRFMMHKFAQRHNLYHLLPYLPPLKGEKSLAKQDRLIRTICQYKGWEYEPTSMERFIYAHMPRVDNTFWWRNEVALDENGEERGADDDAEHDDAEHDDAEHDDAERNDAEHSDDTDTGADDVSTTRTDDDLPPPLPLPTADERYADADADPNACGGLSGGLNGDLNGSTSVNTKRLRYT